MATDADTQQLREHLAECAECQAEWALHQRVGQAIRSDTRLPELRTDAGWHRIETLLDEDLLHPADAVPRASARPPPGGWWTRWLVAAVVVQAVGLGAAGLALREASGPYGPDGREAAQGPQATRQPTGDFRTLSDADVQSRTATVRLVPAPQMSLGSLQSLLVSTGMVAVEIASDGTSLGLAAADGQAQTTSEAVRRLRTESGILLVEPVAPAKTATPTTR